MVPLPVPWVLSVVVVRPDGLEAMKEASRLTFPTVSSVPLAEIRGRYTADTPLEWTPTRARGFHRVGDRTRLLTR